MSNIVENHCSKLAGGSGKCRWLRRRWQYGVCRQTVAISLLRNDSGKYSGSEENEICFKYFKTAYDFYLNSLCLFLQWCGNLSLSFRKAASVSHCPTWARKYGLFLGKELSKIQQCARQERSFCGCSKYCLYYVWGCMIQSGIIFSATTVVHHKTKSSQC
jgi:hypothetical protein